MLQATEHERPTAGAATWTMVSLAGTGVFAGVAIGQVYTSPTYLWTDSKAYEAVASHPIWSLGFWSGQRPPLTPLLWKLTGSLGAFALGQTIVSVVAWGALAFAVGSLLPSGWRRALATLVVLGFATTTPIALWDRSVLSEAMSLASLAGLLAALIFASRRLTWRRGLIVVLACIPCALSRDTQSWTVVMLGLALVTYAVGKLLIKRSVAPVAAVAGIAVLAVGGLSLALAQRAHRNVQNVEDVFIVRMFPFPDRVAWLSHHGMPHAAAIDQLAKSIHDPTNGTAKYVTVPFRDPRFAGLSAWIRLDGEGAYLEWLVTHPGYVVTDPLVSPRLAIDFDPGLTLYAGPDPPPSPLTAVLWPAWWWAFPLVGLAWLVGPLGRVLATWSARTTAVFAAIGVAALYVAWHGDSYEVTRHMIEGYVEVRMSLLVLLLLAFLAPSPESRLGHHCTGLRRAVSDFRARVRLTSP